MGEALTVYRALLKGINRNITSITGNRQWLVFAKEAFRRHRAVSDQEDQKELLQLAKDYVFMIDGVRDHKVGMIRSLYAVALIIRWPYNTHSLLTTAFPLNFLQELLFSYNVGIPIEDREKDMKKRAAALVGLALPPEPEHFN